MATGWPKELSMWYFHSGEKATPVPVGDDVVSVPPKSFVEIDESNAVVRRLVAQGKLHRRGAPSGTGQRLVQGMPIPVVQPSSEPPTEFARALSERGVTKSPALPPQPSSEKPQVEVEKPAENRAKALRNLAGRQKQKIESESSGTGSSPTTIDS